MEAWTKDVVADIVLAFTFYDNDHIGILMKELGPI